MHRLFLPIIFILFSCKQIESKNQSVGKNQSDNRRLIEVIHCHDTLKLFAEYTECGEWGGHTETFKIYYQLDSQHNFEIWSIYSRDTFDCDRPSFHQTVFKKVIQLTPEHQHVVMDYMHELLNESLKPKEFLSNAIQFYSISNTDSSLVITFPSNKYDGFGLMKEKLLH